MAPRTRSRDQRHHPVSRGLGQRTAINFAQSFVLAVCRVRLDFAAVIYYEDRVRSPSPPPPPHARVLNACATPTHLRSNSIISLKSLLNPIRKRISSRFSFDCYVSLLSSPLPSLLFVEEISVKRISRSLWDCNSVKN